MNRKIIIQGRTFTISESGNKTFTTNFIAALARKLPNYEFEIIIPKTINPEEFNLPFNCNFKLLPGIETNPPYVSVSIWENVQIADYIEKQNKKDIVFFLSPHPSLPITKLNIPEFVIIHDIHLWTNPQEKWTEERKFAYAVNKESINNADIVFTVSDFTNRETKKYFKFEDKPVMSIYEDINPFYKQGLKTTPRLIKDKFQVKPNNYFLYIGSFEPRKNLESLLKAYDIYLKNSKSKKTLLIIGSHTTRSKEVDAYKLNPEAKQFAQADLNELYQLYKYAYGFVYPSLYEGFGLQILEAQNLGCPILCSDIPVFHEVGRDGMLYFDPKNPTDIAEKMLHLENNDSLREELISKGKDNAERYSWDKTVDIFLKNVKRYP